MWLAYERHRSAPPSLWADYLAALPAKFNLSSCWVAPFRYLISVIAFPPFCNFRILTSVATLLLTSDPLSLESDLSTRSKTSKWRGLMSTSEWYGTGQYKG